MQKPIITAMVIGLLQACATPPTLPLENPTALLAGLTTINENTTRLNLPATGSLRLKGRQNPAANPALFFNFTSDKSSLGSFNSPFFMRLTTDLTCSTGYDIQAEYRPEKKATYTEYWPKGTLSSAQVDILFSWTPSQITISIANSSKTFQLTTPPKILNLTASGSPFILDN